MLGRLFVTLTRDSPPRHTYPPAMADAAPAPAGTAPGALSQLKIDRSAAPLRRRKRRWPWALGALVLLGAAAALLVPRTTDVQASAVLSAWPSQQYVQLNASGYVVAQRRAAVASKGTGRLLELQVREGSVLKQGELIGRLDASDVAASISLAQAGVAQAQAVVAQAQAGTHQAEAALGQSRAELANAEQDLARQQALMVQGFISAQVVDNAQRRLAVARSALATAQAAVASAQAGASAAQAGIGQSQAQLRLQQVNQANTEIRAPFDGVVLVKNANVGDMITPFSSAAGTSGAVVTMADMGTLEVEADVSESNVARIQAGQPVEITLDALPDKRFAGKVAGIVPTVDRAKATVMTKIRFDQLDARILPEMSAKVAFLSQVVGASEQKPVLAVNPKTVVERDGGKQVLRIAGNKVQALPVTTGRSLGDLLEVSGAGLASGDKLVLSPPAGLKAGASVAVSAK